MSDIFNRIRNSGNGRRIIVGVSLVSIVAASSFVVIFLPQLYDFGTESGIIPVITAPASTDYNEFVEGKAITFNATVYKIERGKLTSSSFDEVAFRDDLYFIWEITRYNWTSSAVIAEGIGMTEITVVSLRPGDYIIELSVNGVSRDYDILDPNDYRTDPEVPLQQFNQYRFHIQSLLELRSWIVNPGDYSNYITGDQIAFISEVKAVVNNSLVSNITLQNLEEYNRAELWLDSDELHEILSPQVSAEQVAEMVSDYDFIDPIDKERYSLSDETTFSWTDGYIDEFGVQYPAVVLSNDSYFTTNQLEKGFHAITFMVNDPELVQHSTHRIHFWVSAKEQPTVPFLQPFFQDVDIDGDVLVDWDHSSATSPNAVIDHYELEITHHRQEFHPGTNESYTEGDDYHSITGNTSYMYFQDLNSSADKTLHELGKHWFRVRAVDTYGTPSLWSNTEGITVDFPPDNIQLKGIFFQNGTRADQHDPSYPESSNGLVSNSNSGGASLFEPGTINPKNTFFDFYQGHFENQTDNWYYDHLPLTESIIYQYQDFSIVLEVSGYDEIDPDENDTRLDFFFFSSIDDLIFKSRGYIGTTLEFTWEEHFFPYLQAENGKDYVPLSPGEHEITVVVVDDYDVRYQLPSLVLEVHEITPSWNASSDFYSLPDYFYDISGDNRSDWGQFAIEWTYPQFNPYMPNYDGDNLTDWQSHVSKLDHWEIMYFFEYGSKNYTEILYQSTPDPGHYWQLGISRDAPDIYSRWELSSGNWSFQIRAVDVNGFVSEWSPGFEIRTVNGTFESPYDTKLQVLLAEDNPPPNAWFNLYEYTTRSEIPVVRVADDIILDASETTDLNGDTLFYTWYFDGIIRDDIGNFDPHGINVTINPEWLGTDINPGKNETDLRDGDDYGDFGLHEITLVVTDGITDVSRSVEIMVIPVNVAPECSFEVENARNMTGNPWIYNWETIFLFPDQLYHFDHEVEKQNLTVQYFLTDLTTGDQYLVRHYLILRDIFNFTSPQLTSEASREYGYVFEPRETGVYRMDMLIRDGVTTVNYSLSFEIIQDPAPIIQSLQISDGTYHAELPFDTASQSYLILQNQPVEFAIQAVDNEQDSMRCTIYAGKLGWIYADDYQPVIATLDEQFFFKKTGDFTVSIRLSDPRGGIVYLSIKVNVMHVQLVDSRNQNTIAPEISLRERFRQFDYQRVINWANTDRKQSTVSYWWAKLGDELVADGRGYFVNDEILLEPVSLPGAQHTRVWFSLDTRTNDELEFYDADNDDLLWVIRRNRDNGKYEYQSSDGNWHSLPKLNFFDTRDNVTSSNYSWSNSLGSRLVYVVMPTDLLEIKWKTGGHDGGYSRSPLRNVWGLSGFKIAYFEAISTGGLEYRHPLEISGQELLNFCGYNRLNLGSVLIREGWDLFKEYWMNHDTGDEQWLFFEWKSSFMEDILEFSLEIQYNQLTTQLIIDFTADLNIKKTELGKKLDKKGWEIIVGGSARINLLIDPFMLIELYATFTFEIRKSIGLADIFDALGQVGIGKAIRKANDKLDDWGLPEIPDVIILSGKVQVSFGWTRHKGIFVLVDLSLTVKITIWNDMVYGGVTFGMWIGGSENMGFEWGAYFTAFFGLDLSLRKLLGDKWYIPNIRLYRKRWSFTIEVPFF